MRVCVCVGGGGTCRKAWTQSMHAWVEGACSRMTCRPPAAGAPPPAKGDLTFVNCSSRDFRRRKGVAAVSV